MTDPKSAVSAAFDPETFRAKGHAAVDALADYLDRAARGGLPVVSWQEPDAMVLRWPGDFGPQPIEELGALLARFVDDSIHHHHPRYVGYQVSTPLPVAAVAELAVGLVNNGMAAYDAGPASSAMERAVIRFFAGALGYGDRADGVLTSGGSLGNLTALLAARQVKAGFDAWTEGAGAGPPLAVLGADQAHYSVARALAITGAGSAGFVTVPVDSRYRLRPDALDVARRSAEASGRKVIAVVASAGATVTGAIDPLDAIADYCGEAGLWLHVDGAHGASAALSRKYRALLRGIERADSVTWDAHKLLAMPALATAVLFRDGGLSYEAFSQSASYLFAAGDPRDQWYNRGVRTLECTKRMMSVPLYASLASLGTAPFEAMIDATFDLARAFAERLSGEPDFDVPFEPECNILCFRHVPSGLQDADGHQERIRRRLLERGEFYLVRTKLDGRVYLRTSLMNPRTTLGDLDALVAAIRAAGAGP